MQISSSASFTSFYNESSTPEETQYQLLAKGTASVLLSNVCVSISKNLSAVIFGVGIGLITATLVLKALHWYNHAAAVDIRRYFINSNHLKIAAIAFIATLALGAISSYLGGPLGFLIGSYSAINLGEYEDSVLPDETTVTHTS